MLLRLPKIGMEMTEAVLVRWLVPEGGRIERGQPLYEIETDKVTTEIDASITGRLRRIAEEGVTYAVGDPVGELLED
jgi:pyruvate/2-oxoglutarate dehydrogenase complex dihydrolipoamide acyltransferase (E2) component